MDQRLSLRRARASDLAAVDALLAKTYPRVLAADYPPSILVMALPIITRARPELLASRRYYVVETSAGQIVGAGGWSGGAPAPGPEGEATGGVGHVRHVVTDVDRLRGGIGRAIMGRVFSDCLHHGVRWLDCLSTRSAVPFYASLGFRIVSPVDVALGPAIDFPAVRMMRQILP